MIEKRMVLKVDLRQFLDDEGKKVSLTEQAVMVFNFLIKIVLSVSNNIEQRLIYIDLECNTRAEQLSCEGSIEASCTAIDMIEWHCDTCQASGSISHWQGSLWDKQKRIIH
jgi:hypothetical protein